MTKNDLFLFKKELTNIYKNKQIINESCPI